MGLMKERKREIDEILRALHDVWYENPGLRLCQLVEDVADNKEVWYTLDEELLVKLRMYTNQRRY